MKVKYYIAKIKHDNGNLYVKTTASSKENAIGNICSIEHCPKRSIQSIVEVTSNEFNKPINKKLL